MKWFFPRIHRAAPAPDRARHVWTGYHHRRCARCYEREGSVRGLSPCTGHVAAVPIDTGPRARAETPDA
jgi:hypothetical protein